MTSFNQICKENLRSGFSTISTDDALKAIRIKIFDKSFHTGQSSFTFVLDATNLSVSQCTAITLALIADGFKVDTPAYDKLIVTIL